MLWLSFPLNSPESCLAEIEWKTPPRTEAGRAVQRDGLPVDPGFSSRSTRGRETEALLARSDTPGRNRMDLTSDRGAGSHRRSPSSQKRLMPDLPQA
jgi:hypothetical protein